MREPLDLASFASAAVRGDGVAMRGWLLAAERASFAWATAERPNVTDACELAVVAGLVEHMAGARAPAWTRDVGPAPHEVTLLHGGPRTLARLRRESPEPLRRRNVLASPTFAVLG